MPRRVVSESDMRSISKAGSKSYAVTIPIEYIRQLGWHERQKVRVTLRGSKIVITDWEQETVSSGKKKP